MSKHTPGPWLFSGTGPVMAGYSQPFGVFAPNLATLVAGCFGDVAGGEAAAEANARLIAAAPDLLAACKAAKKHLEPDLVEPGRTAFWALVEAINKAEKRGDE